MIVYCQDGDICASFQNIYIEITMIVPGTKCFININSFSLHNNIWVSYDYWSHFTDEET